MINPLYRCRFPLARWAHYTALAALVALSCAAGTARAAGVLYLITAEEAAIEADETTLRGRRKELDDGPQIVIESPQNKGVYNKPFPVRVFFHEGASGLPVAMDSLKLVYQKLWGIDITDRVRDYVQQNAIMAPQAELPRGTHTVEVYIEDVDENPSSRMFTVTVK